MAKITYLRFPEKKKLKFVVMGSGKIMCAFIRLLLNKKFPKPVIITHPSQEHQRDRMFYSSAAIVKKGYEDVLKVSREENLEILETKDVNKNDVLRWLGDKKVAAAFSFGCRSIIKNNFLAVLNELVVNCHASDLPKDRGGGGPSWRILNSANYSCISLHLINEGVDSGEIILKKKRPIKKKNPYPIDILTEDIKLAEDVLKVFIRRIEQKIPFKLIKQNLEKGTYFPRLLTEKNAAINWSWGTREIERFIRAFGYPYSGAWTSLHGQKVIIARAKLPRRASYFHPYICGMIFRKFRDGSVEVATRDGSLIIISLRERDSEIPAASRCKPGERFYTPSKILEDSILFRPIW